MRFLILVCFAIILLGSLRPVASQDWKAENQKRTEFLERKNGPGTNLDLQRRLLQMKGEDQELRRRVYDNPENEQKAQEDRQVLDKKLTAELKEIVRQHGWPTIRLVGMEASETATLIFSRSSDTVFQREWIHRLSAMVERDEIIGSALAPVIDTILRSEGRPQLFGSVFRLEGDRMVLEPVQDPENLDRRRARYLLPPINETVKIMEDFLRRKLKLTYIGETG